MADVNPWLPPGAPQDLQAAIQAALMRQQAAAPQQNSFQSVVAPTAEPFEEVKKTPGQKPPNPWDPSHEGQAELGIDGGLAGSRAIDKFSGYADFSLEGLADALGIGAMALSSPVTSAMKLGLTSALGIGSPADAFSVSGSMSLADLNAKANALGFPSVAELAAQKVATGTPRATAFSLAANEIGRAAAALGGANAAIGKARSTTAERDRAYGPGFGPEGKSAKGPAASRAGGPGRTGASY